MRTPYKLGLGALGVLLVVTTRMMMERPIDAGDAPVSASRSGVTQRSLADEGARERSAHGLEAPSDVAVALQPQPGPSAAPRAPREVEYDDSMTELVRMTLAGDEHLTQYWHHRSAPLMSEVDRAAYRRPMSTGANDPETENVDPDVDADVDPDTQSDPALDDGDAAEWAGEGGATTEGPATDDDDDD